MSVLNPRNRLVNFRLSDAEFENLKNACFEQGARSISEFARSSVLRTLADPDGTEGNENQRIEQLGQKVNVLEVQVDQLLRLLAMAGAGSVERTLTPHRAAPTNGLQSV